MPPPPSPSRLVVRRESSAHGRGDAAAVRAVHEKAFPGPLEADLVDALRAARDLVPALSLVAEAEGRVVGHVCCSRAAVDGTSGPVGLGPVGVLPDAQGRGVGAALMYAVLGAADALDVPMVVLLGDPGYYSRFGFVLAETHDIAPPVPDWAPYFQVRPLSAYDPALRGVFTYAPAFPLG